MPTKYLFEKTIHNKYLGKIKTIKAHTQWELEIKVKEQLKKWNEQEKRAREKEKIEDLKKQAEYNTLKAQEKINEFKNLLKYTLKVDDKLDWETQKRKDKYPKKKPVLEEIYKEFKIPKKSLLEFILKNKKLKREKLEEKAKQEYNKRLQEYEEKKRAFIKEQEEYNKSIDEWKNDFENGKTDAIEKYARVVLENSSYPEEIEKEYEIQYKPDIKTLIISYKLLNPQSIPKIVEYKYIASRKEIVPKEMKKKEFETYYESYVYQVALRTIHEIFEAFYIPHVETVIFNGWVDYIDEATGQNCSSCIISLQTSKEEFEKINLELVDYKKCVQNLKGLFAGKLINLAPVKPILDIDKNDSRFIEAKEILSNLHSIDNLATMNWEDFEHLVRQLFEKMFNENGGEVKVTQASRDGGIDAVAFDPDPIRGGKFVIQAKRYNMTVPVSAVRDLYGTMLHEGATKGILVTTSSFGRDAYDFIKDKPITLIDGQNLLYLLNKYGYKNVNIILKK